MTEPKPRPALSSATPSRRKVFRGRAMADVPDFVLESVSDPDKFEHFIGQPSLPGIIALEMSAEGMSAAAIPAFFEAVVQPEDHQRFNAFVRDPKNGIDIETLVEIATYLIEEYTARPTEPSSE